MKPHAARSGPARNYEAITPGDTSANDFTQECDAIYVGVTGNVAVVKCGETTAVTFVGVPAGTILPVRARRVNSTNTTATSLVALFTV